MEEQQKPSQVIRSKIVKSALVNWRDLIILQNDDLKEISPESLIKLKESMLRNHFVCTFFVWDSPEGIMVLDGVHRIKALHALEADGHEVPESFPANFIECKDRSEAASFVLIFSSYYARITADGLSEFLSIENIDLKSLDYIELPHVDMTEIMKESDEVDRFLDDLEKDEYNIRKKTTAIEKKCHDCGFGW